MTDYVPIYIPHLLALLTEVKDLHQLNPYIQEDKIVEDIFICNKLRGICISWKSEDWKKCYQLIIYKEKNVSDCILNVENLQYYDQYEQTLVLEGSVSESGIDVGQGKPGVSVEEPPFWQNLPE